MILKKCLSLAAACGMAAFSGCQNCAQTAPQTALVVIDLQNDYFPGGKFPLWNTENTMKNALTMISRAKEQGVPVILVKHVGSPKGAFLAEGSPGVELRPEILNAAPGAPIVIKKYADSFDSTELKATLDKLGVKKLLLCGMMTQNCVTHTAISPEAAAYEVEVVSDASTTVSEVIHKVALNALSRRVKLTTTAEAFTPKK